MKVSLYHDVKTTMICSKLGIDRLRGFQSADRRKAAFPIACLHRPYNIALRHNALHVIVLDGGV
jgi:hypothetical protein